MRKRMSEKMEEERKRILGGAGGGGKKNPAKQGTSGQKGLSQQRGAPLHPHKG